MEKDKPVVQKNEGQEPDIAEEEEKKPVSRRALSLRYWKLLGSHLQGYCGECGGVCGNTAHAESFRF